MSSTDMSSNRREMELPIIRRYVHLARGPASCGSDLRIHVRPSGTEAAYLARNLLWRIYRPISAYFLGGVRLRASETILVSRLDNRPRHRRCAPVGRERRNISRTC